MTLLMGMHCCRREESYF